MTKRKTKTRPQAKSKLSPTIKFFEDAVVVKDAKKPAWFDVRPKDYLPGAECDPLNCAIANRAKREPGVLAAKILATVAYIQWEDEPHIARRYVTNGPVYIYTAEKLLRSHDEKKLAIPEGGINIKLGKPSGTNVLLSSLPPKERERRRARMDEARKKNELKRKRGLPLRQYRTTISGIRRNYASAIVTAANVNQTSGATQ